MAFLGVRLGNESQLSGADIQELAVAAEDLGYEEIWMTEGAGRDSLTQLTAIATCCLFKCYRESDDFGNT